ncbi:hypothetical protein ACFL5G_02395 [Candidatus Margulisiibacteriota bacterium]
MNDFRKVSDDSGLIVSSVNTNAPLQPQNLTNSYNDIKKSLEALKQNNTYQTRLDYGASFARFNLAYLNSWRSTANKPYLSSALFTEHHVYEKQFQERLGFFINSFNLISEMSVASKWPSTKDPHGNVTELYKDDKKFFGENLIKEIQPDPNNLLLFLERATLYLNTPVARQEFVKLLLDVTIQQNINISELEIPDHYVEGQKELKGLDVLGDYLYKMYNSSLAEIKKEGKDTVQNREFRQDLLLLYKKNTGHIAFADRTLLETLLAKEPNKALQNELKEMLKPY